MEWKDKGVVVTGAGNGIGKAIATRLAVAGARIVVNDLDEAAARVVADQIGGHPAPGDAASVAGAESLVRRSWDYLGHVDAWFGNAGVERGRSLATSEEDWELSHEVNVMAHVRAARLLVPRWLEHGSGRYVLTASAAGLLTLLEGPSYAVTKHGAVAFAEWLAVTYRHRGVVVQTLCPQGVQTQMLTQDKGMRDLLSHDTALTPEQVAESVWEALADDRFLILPHPEVSRYYAARATEPDRWLAGMNKLQRRLEDARASQPEAAS